MAYSSKYVFGFYSEVANSDVTITISEDGYTGSVKSRNLGGAPILRREMNGHIHGTSCTLTLEAQDNDDYMEFYTSDPRKFQVTITRDSYTIFNGFITPELLNVPDLSAPYDVEITAVDGLGELKYITYGEVTSGGHTFGEIFSSICAATGNSGTVSFYTQLKGRTSRSSYVNLENMYINLDCFSEESCYDVLEKLLTSINCEITHSANDGEFFVISKADLSFYESNFESSEFGSMTSCDFWPIGHVTNSVTPAKNRVFVKGETKLMLRGFPYSGVTEDIDEDYVTKSGDVYTVAGNTDGDTRSIITETFSAAPGMDLTLVLRASRVDKTAALGATVTLRATCVKNGVTQTYIPSENKWRPAIVESELETAVASLDGYDEISYKVPITQAVTEGATNFQIIVGANVVIGSFKIEMFKAYGSAPLGYEEAISVDNGARESLEDMESCIVIDDPADYLGIDDLHKWKYAVPYYNDVACGSFYGDVQGPFMYVMAYSYAKQYAAPRSKVTGTLSTPSSLSYIPLMLSRGESKYFVDTAEWNLASDEVTVSLDEMPTATLSSVGSVTKKYGSQAVPDEL